MLLGRSGGEHLPAGRLRQRRASRLLPGHSWPAARPPRATRGSTGLCHFPDGDRSLGALASWDSPGPDRLTPRPPTPTPFTPTPTQPHHRGPAWLLCGPLLRATEGFAGSSQSPPALGTGGPGPGPGRPHRRAQSHGEPPAPPGCSSSSLPPPFLAQPSVSPLAPRQRPASRPISGPFAGYTSPLLSQGSERVDERRPEREQERGGERQTGTVGTECQRAVSRLWASRGGLLPRVVHGHQL